METKEERLTYINTLCNEAEQLIINLLPAYEFGEDSNAERLYDIIQEFRDIAEAQLQQLTLRP